MSGIDSILVTTLEDIAWLLNLRGSDVPRNMIFKANLLVRRIPRFRGDLEGNISCDLFIDEKKVQDIKPYLKSNSVTVHAPESMLKFLKDLSEMKIFMDVNTCNASHYLTLQANKNIELKFSIELGERYNRIASLKRKKNVTEREGMRQANLRDCASMIRYFAWLEESMQDPNHTITEYVAAEKCEEFKSQGSDLAIRPAFGTMMAFGSNSSCMHYFPDEDTALRMDNGTLLLDSGFHYHDGTTDISRTLWLGDKEPSQFTKEVYTRSL